MKQGLKLIDNSSGEYKLSEILKELFLNDSYSQVSIATGYWDLPAMVEVYDELKKFLDRENTSFRLLLGEEPTVKAYQVRRPKTVDPDFPHKFLKTDLENLELKDEFQKVANLLDKYIDDDLLTSKIQIKIYKKCFLHAKCYIFGSDEENAVGIIGSSNFTKQGISGNLELNQFEDNNATVNFVRKNLNQHPSHRSWFEDLWKESEDWTGTFKEEILNLSKHGKTCFSPYEMYIHALYRIFYQDLEDEKADKIGPDDPSLEKPELLKFQIQNANSIIKKLERQGVAMLSDSVGLGKTYTAIKVIEYYKNILNQRVVVIVPASLRTQWEKSFNEFKMVHLPEIYSLQDINRIENIKENLKAIPVGLFVFDESHNLRSSGGQRFDVFIQWKQENENARTLMVTATPINNQLSDLTNQIMLASGGNIFRLGKFYDRQKEKFFTLKERLDLLHNDIKSQIRSNGVVDYTQIKEQLTPLLNRFIVRRTRQGIEREYPDGLNINGELQKFPVSRPDNLYYKVQNQYISKLLEFTSEFPEINKIYEYTISSLADLEYLAHPLDLLNKYEKRLSHVNSSLEIIYSGILALGFPCYRYNIYRNSYYEKKRGELELNAEDNRNLSRQIGIYGIFRTIFLKRLESSFKSILVSTLNYKKKLIDFDEKLRDYDKIISVKNLAKLNKALDAYNEQSSDEDELDFDINSFEDEEEGFETIDADTAVFNIDCLKNDIQKELKIISILEKQITFLISKDDKIFILANELNKNAENKILIFTYFTDTLKYLQEQLPPLLSKNKNIEFALGNKYEIENFAERFAPFAKKYTLKPSDKEIDFLIASDKLSEGQNLQDCGIIINYDLHWNPVRMIQRNGRINRIGTKHKEIIVYNFRPEEQLEQYLQLVRKLETKINLIRYTIGSDQSVLDEEPIPQEYTEDLYSKDEKKRLEAFKKIFETSELLAAEDLFMEDLRDFDRSENFSPVYKEKIRNLPKGKWGNIQFRKEDEEFTYLAHMIDDNEEAGYFVAFDDAYTGELMTPTEGLLYIKANSDNNERFIDRFRNKPEIESKLNEFVNTHQFAEDKHLNRFAQAQSDSITKLIETMTEYGNSIDETQKVYECILYSQNAYTNKQNLKLIRILTKLRRENKHIPDELIKKFVSLAHQYKPEEISEKAPLNEIIQIFEF